MKYPIIDDAIDLGPLLRAFDDMATSYKLVFFQATLNLLGKQQIPNNQLDLRDIAVEMLALSYFPHTFFKLSFGSRDQIAIILEQLSFSVNETAIANPKTQAKLREQINADFDRINAASLLRYVQYRFLTPFFDEELRGLPDGQKNKRIIDCANSRFFSNDPALYRFNDEKTQIEIHPQWSAYLRQSSGLVNGWVRSKWIDFLQSKNPNTPAVSNKITPPIKRSALTIQTQYWRNIMQKSPIKCLYSGEALSIDRFALDHFVPWSFVCHDQLWNLIPVLPEANSSKSNHLPSLSYLNGFIETQLSGLETAQHQLKGKAWQNITESYISDLRVSHDELLKPDYLHDAYQTALPAIISLAGQNGFAMDWKL